MSSVSYTAHHRARFLGLGLTFLLALPHRAAAGPVERLITDTFVITGMTCGGCEVGVEIALRRLDGVRSAEASYDDGTATVSYDAERVTPDQIVAAIEKLGYKARRVEPTAPKPERSEESRHRRLDKQSMRCPS